MTDREKFETYFAPIAEVMSKCGIGKVGIERRKEGQWQGWQAALASQQPADDGWTEWGGDDCPVLGDVVVDLKFRDGKHLLDVLAKDYQWNHRYKEYDIISYRVVKP